MIAIPHLAYGSPRKLPKARDLPGHVVVLDIAFAAEGGGGASFERTTRPFIDGLGARLAMWVDHHDHVMHAAYADDPRFILSTKAQHGACPEMVTPELVRLAGPVETICCHTDFDGLCSAAKWIRRGEEPYEGADDDARAIDTRIGKPGERAEQIDRALRARPRDDGLKGMIVRYLVSGATDLSLYRDIRDAAELLRVIEEETHRLAEAYEIDGDLAVVDARAAKRQYDKTLLLLLGQERATVSIVHDATTLTAAARFDSGVDLLALLGLAGGMPTRVSVPTARLDELIAKLRARPR